MLARYEELSMNYSDETADEFSRLQDRIDHENLWELDRQLEIAMDALRLPPPDADVSKLSGGETPPRGALPDAAAQARHAAPRRADQPSRRRVGRLAGASPRRVQGDRRRRHPRPLLPRQRRRLDPRARPRRRHPVGGQLLLLAGAEGRAPGPGGEGVLDPPPDARSTSSSGSSSRRAPATPRARRASTTTRSSSPRSRRRSRAATPTRFTSRPAHGSETSSSRRKRSRRPTATTC